MTSPSRGAAAPDACGVSVVAVSWNTSAHLPVALDALPAACAPYPYEVVVVDNGSSDDSVEVLTRRKDVKLVALDTNTGFTRAANVGARAAARHPFLLFLNPDVVGDPGSIALLLDAVACDDGACGATPWFLNDDRSAQYFWRRIPDAAATFFCLTRIGRRIDGVLGRRAMRRRDYRDLFTVAPALPVAIDGVGAACLLVRRSDFEAAGGFDERYFNFFQDAELERTMKRKGRRLLGVGQSVVVHTRGVSLRSLPDGEVDGQFLFALRQFLKGAGTIHRVAGELVLRVELMLPGGDPRRRALALGRTAPLVVADVTLGDKPGNPTRSTVVE